MNEIFELFPSSNGDVFNKKWLGECHDLGLILFVSNFYIFLENIWYSQMGG